MPVELPRASPASRPLDRSPLVSRHFVVPKLGENEEHCQDSVEVRIGAETQLPESLFAVSDGATESFCPRNWALALTRNFVDDPKLCFSNWNLWLAKPRKKWLESAQEFLQQTKPEFRLFHENGLSKRTPAAATFVGLWVRHADFGNLPWQALLLGDSSLFHLRGDGSVLKYGMQKKSADYCGDAPMTLSYASEKSAAPTHLSTHFSSNGEVEIRPGDVMILATDALSKWLLEREESGAPVWGAMLRIQTRDEFVKLVESARSEASLPLKNDDTSLVVVCYGVPHSAYVNQVFIPAPLPATQPPIQSNSEPRAEQKAAHFQPLRFGAPPIFAPPAQPIRPESGRLAEPRGAAIALSPQPVLQAVLAPSTISAPPPAQEPARARRPKIIEWFSRNMPVVGLNLVFLFLVSFVAANDISLFQYVGFGVNLLAIFLIAYLDVDAVGLSQELKKQARNFDAQKRLWEEQRAADAARITQLEANVKDAADNSNSTAGGLQKW